MIMCVLLCYPVSIRIYYQQDVLFLVVFHMELLMILCHEFHLSSCVCGLIAQSPIPKLQNSICGCRFVCPKFNMDKQTICKFVQVKVSGFLRASTF